MNDGVKMKRCHFLRGWDREEFAGKEYPEMKSCAHGGKQANTG